DDPLCLHPAALARMQDFIASVREGSPGPIEIEIIGAAGSGKRTLAAQLAARIGRRLLIGEAAMLLADKPAEGAADSLVRLGRKARACGASPYWRGADGIGAAVWRAGRGMYDLMILDREAASGDAPAEGVVRHSVRLAPLARAQRLALWARLSDAPPPAPV